jgi:GT2 family glycosyltransferase
MMGDRAPSAWTLINGFLLLNRLSQDVFPGVHRSRDVRGLVDCDWICGACLMVRREVADAFAWRQFGSGDDFDYCIQIRESGWRIAATGDAQVIHFIGRSFTTAQPGTWTGTPSNFARYLRSHRGPVHAAIGIAGMRLGLRLRGAVHHLLYTMTRDPERLYKVNKTRQFLACSGKSNHPHQPRIRREGDLTDANPGDRWKRLRRPRPRARSRTRTYAVRRRQPSVRPPAIRH